MIRIFMMQSMAIDPGDRIYINREGVVHDRHGFDEPFLVIECAVSNPQMKYISQEQSTHKPAKNKISRADRESLPRPQVSRSRINAGQHVEKNDEIAAEIVNFHDRLPAKAG